MSKQQSKSNPRSGAKEKGKQKRAASEPSLDLDSITTWDTICYDPTDAYMHEPELNFEDGSFDPGEEYPRGV